jgi:hypothetical protein
VAPLVDIVARAGSASLGFALGGGILAFLWWRAATRWRELAQLYPAPAQSGPRRTFWPTTVILHAGGWLYSFYPGVAIARICKDGVALSLTPPWSFAHPALFFPLEEISVAPHPWYVIGEAFEIKTRRAPHMTIVIDGAVAHAITQAQPLSAGIGAH